VCNAVAFVPGAEVLPEERAEVDEEVENDNTESDDEDGWVDMPSSEEEDNEEDTELEISDDDDEESDENAEDGWETDSGNEDEEEAEDNNEEEEDDNAKETVDGGKASLPKKLTKSQKKKVKAQEKAESATAKLEKAKLVSESRILTDADFRQIKAHQIRKKMAAERKHQNDKSRKRTNDDVLIDEEVQEKIARREEGDGLPRLNDIEHFHKKFHRQTKEERKAQVEAGREGREDFGKPKKKGPHVGRTNRELAKKKNYQMVQQKVRGKNRNRSFRDKQMSLRKYLLRQAGKKAN
jgi:protein SDA1